MLRWFKDHAYAELAPCPSDVGLSLRVALPRRGIWKPSGLQYAVSVVKSPRGPHEDQDPIRDTNDGTWEYYYHQEGTSAADIHDPESLYTNRGLFRCLRDRVPVGVVIPSANGCGYQVLGLAFVEGFSQGFFRLVGPVTLGAASKPDAADASSTVSAALVSLPFAPFDIHAEEDNRLRVIQAVYRRQGGPRFRRALLYAYQGRCAMTQYDAEPALEAAHIVPYKGPQTNHPANGLLLRADMHDLFDLGLIAVKPESMRIHLATELSGTMYEQYEAHPLWLPHEPELRPSAEALERHWQLSAVARCSA